LTVSVGSIFLHVLDVVNSYYQEQFSLAAICRQ